MDSAMMSQDPRVWALITHHHTSYEYNVLYRVKKKTKKNQKKPKKTSKGQNCPAPLLLLPVLAQIKTHTARHRWVAVETGVSR